MITYEHVDAMEATDGALRLYRRRGLFGILRRQDIYYPPGEWKAVLWSADGSVEVTVGPSTGEEG